jgi:glutamine synthetase
MPRTFSPHRGEQERASDAQRARLLQQQLAGQVTGVATTYVDHAGGGRVKVIPLARLEHAARAGVGFSPVIDAFTSLGGIDSQSPLDRPDGDLRMVPDLDQLVVLRDPEGWAWAPGDRFTQDGGTYRCCQRSFARAQVEAGLREGISALMAFEYEWMVGQDEDDFVPAFRGTGYGMSRFAEAADYLREVLESLEAAGVRVEQIHPEYGPAQFEISVGAQDPVSAADTAVLVKLVISAVTRRHGLRAAFGPAVVSDNVGNGGHLHASFRREGKDLLAGGDGRYGLTQAGESMMAALLENLPALCAIGAPMPASYLRLQPSRWAGAYQIWGPENREAALRFIQASPFESGTANLELKCFDLSANPYLLAGAVLAVALAGAGRGAVLPEEVTGDPAAPGNPQGESAVRLPASLAESLKALEANEELHEAAGDELMTSFAASRRAEIALADGASADEIIASSRWLI